MATPRKRHGGFRIPPRRFQLLLVLAVVVSLLIWVSSPASVTVPSVPTVAELSETAKHAADIIPRPKLPKLYNPFGGASHAPPEQEDSREGRTKWYSDWKWLNPFSSDTTLDEQRAVLPPLSPRPPIYTFYDRDTSKDSDVVKAENKLLLTWRRAWWAKGFRPIVLGKPEASKNPLYQRLQRLKLEKALETELTRWLAWDHMGGGILANWLVLPMAPYEDSTLVSLRRGNFAALTMYKNLGNGLFSGGSTDINSALIHALDSDSLEKSTTMIDVLSTSAFGPTTSANGVAYYDLPTISKKYSVVAKELSSSRASGLNLLQQLINAHLHITWQSAFPSGIAVLQPHPRHMNTLVRFASHIAQDLLLCPQSPMPASCPPNRPSCTTCTSTSSQLVLTTPETFRNKSTQFALGTVPHPYTFTMLHYSREEVDVKLVRRDTLRDLWLNGTTFDLLGSALSGPQRLVRFKEAVASEYGKAHSLWVTAELEEQLNRDWIFGFELPASARGRQSGVASPKGASVPTTAELAREKMLLELGRETLRDQSNQKTVDMVEAWNMADAEAWRFVRAFAVRRRVEREKWEKEESQFAGSESGSSATSKWFDAKRWIGDGAGQRE